MGEVFGGARTVIEALRASVGESGTLLFPAFSYREVYETRYFSQNDTPCCVGAIPEEFRKTKGTVRSIHPTHSVTAIGRYAADITRGHELDRTPMGIHSPYRRLAEYNAKILMLGCSLRSTSYMHALEEEAEVEYCLTPYEIEYTVNDGSSVVTNKYRKHNFARKTAKLSQEYTRITDVMTEGCEYVRGKIHGADSYLIDAAKLRARVLSKMKEDPYYFVDLPEGYVPGVE